MHPLALGLRQVWMNFWHSHPQGNPTFRAISETQHHQASVFQGTMRKREGWPGCALHETALNHDNKNERKNNKLKKLEQQQQQQQQQQLQFLLNVEIFLTNGLCSLRTYLQLRCVPLGLHQPVTQGRGNRKTKTKKTPGPCHAHSSRCDRG